ncbi:MAG: transporter substrate-binding domain-containing protein [Motiliproteus sp.]
MRLKRAYTLLLSIFLLPGITFSEIEQGVQAPQTRWMSEQYPPYNYIDPQGKARGISVEILAAMWQQLGIPEQPLEFLPWARSYTLLQRQPQTALFAMTYTPTREQLFRFVGPFIRTRIVLLAPRSARLQITNNAEIEALKIGVVRDDIGASLLNERGISQDRIIHSNQAENLIKLLHRGRVDAIAYSDDVAEWKMRKAGIDPQEYESVFTLLEGQLGFAFHAQTPAPWLNRLQQALEQVEASGAAQKIRQKYLLQQRLSAPKEGAHPLSPSAPGDFP